MSNELSTVTPKTVEGVKERTHSIFSPSRLATLQKCPAWAGRPALTSDAQRGIDLHEIITSAFMGRLWGHPEPTIEHALIGLKKIRQDFPYTEWLREAPINTGLPLVSGYADIIGLDTRADKYVLIELKTGYGDRPEAGDNLQLKAYAAGLLREAETVHGYLVEVDKQQVTTATWTRQDLLSIHNEIIEVIRLSLQGSKYKSGPYCEYCNKTFICPALEQVIISIQTAEAAINEAKTLTPAEVSEKLSAYWERMEVAERYWSNLKARAISIIGAGGEVEGFTVRTSAGMRKWQDEPLAATTLFNAGIDPYSLMTLQSPAAIEKTLKTNGMKAAEIKALLSGLTIAGEKRRLVIN